MTNEEKYPLIALDTLLSSSEENIRVIIRTRPLNKREIKNKEFTCLQEGNLRENLSEIIIRKNDNHAESFRCNGVFMGNVSQQEFFRECGIIHLLNSTLQGYRSCAFAYGQTGAGKTHTIIGTSSALNCYDDDCGILGRSLVYLYERLDGMNVDYTVKISCLELYQEQIYDLLTEERDRAPLIIREHPTEGFFVDGSEAVECSNLKSAQKTINRALKSRHIGSHDLNHRSNRSHFITEISVEIPEQQSSGSLDEIYTVMGRMTFVDLAGSERLKSTNSNGKILQETGSINSSLYVLGKVISGLSKMTETTDYQKDIPYRDSKLTKLLINSLGGASRTMIISCVSEGSGSLTESLRTIHFSMSAARIRNRPIRYLDPQQKLILELRDEIKRLKRENFRLRDSLSREPTRYSHESANKPQPDRRSRQLEFFEKNPKETEDNQSTQLPSPVRPRRHLDENPLNSTSPTPPQKQLTHISSQPNMNYENHSYASSLLARSKSQKELPRWDGTVSLNATVKDDKFDKMARDMYQEYLKFEQKSKGNTQTQMESPFPPNHPLNRSKDYISKAKPKKTTKSGPRIPYIKEGSARVLTKSKGPNPYTAHLRKSKTSQKQPRQPQERYPAPQSAFPELSSPQLARPSAAHVSSSNSSLPAVNQRNMKRVEAQSDEQDSRNSKISSVLSPTKNIKSKLQKLEHQLHHQRRDIESDPSKATKEKWAQLETLEDEVRDMRLELQLSEQLHNLFPVDKSSSSQPKENISTKHIEHFPLPAIESNDNSPTPMSPYPSQSSSNSLTSSQGVSPLRSQYHPSATSKTEDSLTYSQYNPSDTIRTISSMSPSPSPMKTQSSGSTYLDTLHGEKLVKTPSEKGIATLRSEKDDDYQEDKYDAYSPLSSPQAHLSKHHVHSAQSDQEQSRTDPPSSSAMVTADDQSYLDDEFEADEYGEEEFESL